MVDTLVLGTSAKAWEFESLHAQSLKDRIVFYPVFYYAYKFPTGLRKISKGF